MLRRSVAKDSHMQGINRLSVGWVRDVLNAVGWRMKRKLIIVRLKTSKTKKKMKTIFPIVRKPSNVCGCDPRTEAMPPVDMVSVNHAHVKCWTRCRKDARSGSVKFSSSFSWFWLS
jgi:hypothetical protein